MSAGPTESRPAAGQPRPQGRNETTTEKVPTEFGTLYVHVEVADDGRPVGGAISTPGKEPDSEIARLVAALSEGLDAALKSAGGADSATDRSGGS